MVGWQQFDPQNVCNIIFGANLSEAPQSAAGSSGTPVLQPDLNRRRVLMASRRGTSVSIKPGDILRIGAYTHRTHTEEQLGTKHSNTVYTCVSKAVQWCLTINSQFTGTTTTRPWRRFHVQLTSRVLVWVHSTKCWWGVVSLKSTLFASTFRVVISVKPSSTAPEKPC